MGVWKEIFRISPFHEFHSHLISLIPYWAIANTIPVSSLILHIFTHYFKQLFVSNFLIFWFQILAWSTSSTLVNVSCDRLRSHTQALALSDTLQNAQCADVPIDHILPLFKMTNRLVEGNIYWPSTGHFLRWTSHMKSTGLQPLPTEAEPLTN